MLPSTPRLYTPFTPPLHPPLHPRPPLHPPLHPLYTPLYTPLYPPSLHPSSLHPLFNPPPLLYAPPPLHPPLHPLYNPPPSLRPVAPPLHPPLHPLYNPLFSTPPPLLHPPLYPSPLHNTHPNTPVSYPEGDFGGHGNSFYGEGGYRTRRAQLRYTIRVLLAVVRAGNETVVQDLCDQGLIDSLIGKTFS